MGGRWKGCRRARSIAGIAAALCLSGGLASAPAEAAAKIGVQTPRVEIQALTAGETAEAEFSLANTGTEPLKIERVNVTCGCVTTSYPETLNPGEKGALKVKLVSSAFWNGTVEKQITVMSNDPDRPSLDLQLVAQMRPLFHFSPSNPFAVNYKKGDVIRQVFTLTPGAEASARITRAATGTQGAEARILPAEPGDPPGVTRVEVTARPPDGGSDFSSFVLLETNHPQVPTLMLVINGISQDGIVPIPSFLYLGSLGAGPSDGPPKIVTLSRRLGSFRILEVQPDSPALKAETRPPAPGDDGGFREIHVRYLGGWQPGRVSGKIVVKTDDPQNPVVEIPYQGVVE